MLKKIITTLCLVTAITTTAVAQSKEPKGELPTIFTRAPCDTLPNMVATVKKYDEKLLFTGSGMTFAAPTGQPYRGGLMFLVNQDTGSWTIFQLFGDGMACMIMNGKDFSPYTGD